VILVRTDVSEENFASVIRIERNSELLVTANLLTSSDSFHPDDGGDMFIRNVVFARATGRHIPEGSILLSHSRENLKSCAMALFFQIFRPQF
jgi:hypothetical protein